MIQTTSAANAEQELEKIQHECSRLRRSLAQAETERNQYRKLLLTFLGEKMTADERAELDRRAENVLANGGRPLRELLDMIDEFERA